MTISYMIDGQGYLITNREIISAGTISKKNLQIYGDTKFKYPAEGQNSLIERNMLSGLKKMQKW